MEIRMRVVRFTTVFLALIAVTVLEVFAGGFENSGIGAKAVGMAGAFRAVADDWTAAFYNPAGYAYALDNQLGGNSAFVHFRDEVVPNYRWGGLYESGVFNDQPLYNYHEILSLPSAGLIVRLPIWGETVFGLSAYQPFDYNVTWKLYKPLESYNPAVNTPPDQYRNNLDVVAFQLTAAREFVEDELALGLGLQVLRGDLLFNSIVFRENPLKTKGDTTVELWARPRDKITQWSRNDGYGWGFGFKAGALWKLNEKFNLAATVSVPFDLTVAGTSELAFYMPTIGNIDSAAVKNIGTVGQLFVSGDKVVDETDFETTMKLPPSIALGLAYSASERLTIALDAEYTFWSRFDGFDFTYTNHRGLTGPADTSAFARNFFIADLSFPVEWKDAGKVQLGVSYDVADILTLLAGISSDQSPARDVKRFSPLFVDTGNKYGFNGGLIVHIEHWDLGLMTSYIRQPDLTVSTPETLGEEEELVLFPGEYKAATYETILSFNYRF
jgi:long-chain fatty acid transport protein